MQFDVGFSINRDKKLFFCGIGGISMLSLAILCAKSGFCLGGSDASPSEKAKQICKKNNIPLFISHDENNVIGYDIFVYTAAIKTDNPEFKKARELGLTMLSRAELMGMLTSGFRDSVAICGTHGKSTSTAMIYSIFSCEGRKPYLLCGAEPVKSGRALEIGDESFVIYEACEYNRSFLKFTPKTALVLNIEREHTDTYPTLFDAENAFFEFTRRCSLAILSYDDPACKRLESRLIEYGVKTANFSLDRTRSTLFAKNIKETRGFFEFDAIYRKEHIGHVNLSVPGEHNVKNALAAMLTALEYGMENKAVIGGIQEYIGLRRRFEYIGSYNGADIFDDYAHHPTEIRATLECARKMGYEKIICVFQAHTYSRTHDLFNEFATAFEKCDEVIFAKIYAAREENVYGVSPRDLLHTVKNGKYIESYLEIISYLMRQANPKTMILTMGAGEMNKIAFSLVSENKANF